MEQYKDFVGALVLGTLMVGLSIVFVLWVAKVVLW